MSQPVVFDRTGRRRFACSAAGVAAFIVKPGEQLLMISAPKTGGRWTVVSGALEPGETLLEGVLREVREELGERARVRPLGVLHAYTYHYDDAVRYAIGICYLLEYLGGDVVPSDDLAGGRARWVGVDEVERGTLDLLLPSRQPWLVRRSLELYRVLRDAPPVALQPSFEEMR